MDSYCVDEIFEKPWMGAVTSAFASIVVFIPLPFILPFINWQWPSFRMAIAAIISGALIQISQALYFQSLKNCEVEIVSSYWNLIPVILPILSFIILGEILSIYNYLGIAVLILASTFMLNLDKNLEVRMSSFAMMSIASLLQALAYILQKTVYSRLPFVPGYIFIISGLIITGLLPLLHPTINRVFVKNIDKLISKRMLFVAIEVINLLALSSAEIAIMLGIPSLVAAAETTMPAFTIGLSISLPSIIHERHSKKNIQMKLLAVGMMTFGVFLISR